MGSFFVIYVKFVLYRKGAKNEFLRIKYKQKGSNSKLKGSMTRLKGSTTKQKGSNSKLKGSMTKLKGSNSKLKGSTTKVKGWNCCLKGINYNLRGIIWLTLLCQKVLPFGLVSTKRFLRLTEHQL